MLDLGSVGMQGHKALLLYTGAGYTVLLSNNRCWQLIRHAGSAQSGHLGCMRELMMQHQLPSAWLPAWCWCIMHMAYP